MNEDTTLQRLIYYKGQLLTAQDFEDQQKYHKQKLEQLTQRFPIGIVRGLKIIFSKNSDGSEALKILGGLAIDSDGKAIVVPEEGILVSVPNGLEKPFLSLKYTESKSRRNLSPLEPKKPFDRIVETIKPIWGKKANISDEEKACVTVAKLRDKTDADKSLSPEVLGSNYVIEGEDDPTIRLDASLIGTDQIKDKAVITDKINDDAITSAKIADWDRKTDETSTTGITTDHIRDGAVTTDKLANNLEATPKNGSVTSAKIANWVAGSDPETGIKTDHIQDGAVTTTKLADTVQATPKDNSVTEGKIAANAVTKEKIKNGEITSEKLADTVQATPKDNSVTEGKIAANAVTKEKIKNGEITSEKLADTVQATPKDNSVTEGKIATNAVTKEKIKNGEVTSEKLSLVTDDGSERTISPNTTLSAFTVTANLSEIIQIIPIQGNGILSWSSSVQLSGNKLIYEIVVTNKGGPGSEVTHFKVCKINLGI
jgi:hypothetical protein